jgi:pyruvate carboxylase
VLYPKVFEEFAAHRRDYSDTSGLSTPVFLCGPVPGEELSIDIEEGKTLIVKFLTVGDPHADGSRSVFFELNGQPRDVSVIDRSLEPEAKPGLKADRDNPNQVGANMPGMVVTVAVQPGDRVAKGQKLLTLEAMKMQTNITAERNAKVDQVLVKPGTQVETGDLLMTFQ